ncbi:MAG TPA: hypothetical protein VMK84_09180 [Streptosporangiaceae bacterium]|nr:hypothetical protein [Streptosporangiaceae bacterium]
MHRADPYASRPSPRRRGRHPLPYEGGPASSLLQPPPDQGPAPWTPRRAQVTIRENHPASHHPRTWIGNYRIHPLDVITALLAIAVLLAIFWPR